jgi:hypothetical protein
MTPEELAEARLYAACYQDGYVHDLMHNLLDHIDQQAARIAALEAQLAALKKIAENDHPLAESDWGVAYRLRTYRTLHAPGAVDDGGKR